MKGWESLALSQRRDEVCRVGSRMLETWQQTEQSIAWSVGLGPGKRAHPLLNPDTFQFNNPYLDLRVLLPGSKKSRT
jgi:hypothetical protein